MKNFIGGVLVGMANIIPGVSGGTIIVLLGLFEKTMDSISTLFKIKISFKERLNSLKFLIPILLGCGVGLVVFAKVLTFLFNNFENQTLLCFCGLILFSIPMLKKQEMNDTKISWVFFILGLMLIGLLVYFSPSNNEVVVTLDEIVNKDINIMYILILILLGIISGGTMIFPGVSGSMVLLVLGYYHLFKGYVANVTSFDPKVIIGLIFIAIGVGLGIILSAKLTSFLLKRFRRGTMSFILGLIVMSAFVIIPLKGYDVITLITSILSFLLGCGVVIILEKLKSKKTDI